MCLRGGGLLQAGLGIVVAVVMSAPRAAIAQPVTFEVAVAAELEISTADPRIAVYRADTRTYTERDPATDSAASEATVDAWSGESGLIRRLWGRAHVRGSLTTGELTTRADALPTFELVNTSDDPIRLEGRIHIPDVLLRDSPGDYFDRASTEEQAFQYVRLQQLVRVFPPDPDAPPETVLSMTARTRPPDSWEPGPGVVEMFGVPFSRPGIWFVPPSFTTTETDEEIIIEIRPWEMMLFVNAEAFGSNALGGTTEPLVIDESQRCLDGTALPRTFPALRRDSLCRVGRGSGAPVAVGDAPICSCLRDDALRSQRCRFSFADLLADADVTAPLLPGEIGEAAWTFRPVGKSGGSYDLKASLFVDGKWVPVEGHGKNAGKYAPGQPVKGSVRFTAPQTPTILRTVLRLLPAGAKKPIESTSDVFVALRKPRVKQVLAK